MPLICNLVLSHSHSFLKFPNLEDTVTWNINEIAIEKKRIYSSRVSSKLLNVLICSKFAKYFPKEYHLTKKSKKKDKVIILNDILRLTYIRMYHKFISFYVTCINYRNVVSHINYCNDVTPITWVCGMEFFINPKTCSQTHSTITRRNESETNYFTSFFAWLRRVN